MPTDDSSYKGEELHLFAHAINWKRYLRFRFRPYTRGDVLEVGAGLGKTTDVLLEGNHSSWTCLEPDARLAEELSELLRSQAPGKKVDIFVGSTADLPPHRLFDTVIYIDVLEHIECDSMELQIAAQHLRPNGVLAILAPAHQWLFTAFDAAIGHLRRYNRRSLRDAAPADLIPEKLIYMDSVGLIVSMANRYLLKQAMPTLRQIKMWDRCVIPLSRILDPLIRYCVGKSVLGIWRKPGE